METLQCPQCEALVDRDANYCARCGIALTASSASSVAVPEQKYCVTCGVQMHAEAEVCPACGVRQPMDSNTPPQILFGIDRNPAVGWGCVLLPVVLLLVGLVLGTFGLTVAAWITAGVGVLGFISLFFADF